MDRDRQATVTVTYVSDPASDATTDVARSLCGEGVRTGARVLVTARGVPLLSRVDTLDVAQDAPLQSVVPAPPCPPFQFHREYGTIANPIQLLPGSYLVTVTTKVGGKMRSKTVAFDTDTCGFDATTLSVRRRSLLVARLRCAPT